MITLPVTNNDTASRGETERDGTMSAEVLPRDAIGSTTVDVMYEIYSASYADTCATRFRVDLDAKTHVLLLRTADGALCGFSTLQLYASDAAGRPVRVIYSGDTIIDPEYWGNSTLAFEWLRFAGRVFREDPELPLYWLLIVKGHRTYRFLSTFARSYLPHHKQDAEPTEAKILDQLAHEKFGTCYDSTTGVVRFGPNSGRLGGSLADVPDRHRRLPAVRYFLERNPGYRDGDELVCLCRLADDNLKPLTRRVFSPVDPV